MRRLLIPLLCVAVLGVAVAEADAGAQSLLFPGIANKLEDNDWELVALQNEDGDDDLLEVGELLIGMFQIQQVQDAADESNFNDPVNYTFTGIFVVEVGAYGYNSDVGLHQFDFIPYAGDWSDLLDPSDDSNLGLPDTVATNTMAKVYSDYRSDTGDPFVQVEDSDDNDLTLKAAMETAHKDTATLMWEFGFDPDPDEDVGLHWTGFTNSQNINNVISLTTLVNADLTHLVPGFWPLLKHNWLWVDQDNAAFTTMAHFQGLGGIGTGSDGVFDLVTDTDFYILPTPEPGSLVLLGIGLASMGGFIFRRRRNRK